MWHEGDDLFYIMYEKDGEGKNRDVRVDSFPVASGGWLAGLHSKRGLFDLASKRPLAAYLPACPPPACLHAGLLIQPAELLNELMGLLRDHIKASPILRHKLFQASPSIY